MKGARLFVLSCTALTLSVVAVPAYAGSNQTTFKVSANVDANCTIAANDLAFGGYDPAGSAVDGQSQITVTCTNSAAWKVGLDAGGFSGATTSTRKMTGPSGYSLAYGLFTDAARTSNWGNGAADTLSGNGTGGAQAVTVYGRIAAGQNVGAGGYEDTITATVTF